MQITYQKTNPYPNITQMIQQEIQTVSEKMVQDFRLIRAKAGVYVYRCLYDGIPAVVKYFEKEDDRRELLNYQILTQYNIPTVKVLTSGKATLVMEDISCSEQWRLGAEEDFQDTDVAESLARWYFTFHENGVVYPGLHTLYFEYDCITEENLNILIQKLPQAIEVFRFLLDHYDRVKELIYKPSFTLTYNDFYWTNFVVRGDKQEAMMFDYNLLGRGYRYSDFRNVCSSLPEGIGQIFQEEYGRLYQEKYGRTRLEEEKLEMCIDEVVSPLFSLIVAVTENETFPEWAEDEREEAINGMLLSKARQLLSLS